MNPKNAIGVKRAIALFAVALALRLWNLGHQSFWLDEGFSVWMSSHSFRDIVRILEVDSHPPLFYFFLHLWLKLGREEAFLRLPFALLGVINAFLIYVLGKRLLGERAAWIAAFLWACSFAVLEVETQVRMYSQATALCLLSSILLLEACRRSSPLAWLGYLVSIGAAFYTHYYAGLVLAAHLLFLGSTRRFKEAAWVVLGLLVLYLPWSSSFLTHFFTRVRTRTPPLPINFFSLFSVYLGTYYFLVGNAERLLSSLIGFVGAAVGGYFLLREKAPERRLLVLLFFVPFFLLAVSRFASSQFFIFRYISIFAPYFFLLVAFALSRLKTSIAGSLIAAWMALNVGYWGLFATGPSFQRQNWRGVSTLLRAALRPGDSVLVEQFLSFFPLQYYLPDYFQIDYLINMYTFAVVPDSRKGVVWIPLNENFPNGRLLHICRTSQRVWLVSDPLMESRFNAEGWLNGHTRSLLSLNFPSFDPNQNLHLFLFRSSKSADAHHPLGKPENSNRLFEESSLCGRVRKENFKNSG